MALAIVGRVAKNLAHISCLTPFYPDTFLPVTPFYPKKSTWRISQISAGAVPNAQSTGADPPAKPALQLLPPLTLLQPVQAETPLLVA